MKKTISIIAIITLMFVSVFSAYSTVFAATGDATFTLTCEAPKAEAGRAVAQTKELTLYYGVKDFVNFAQFKNQGINSFAAALEYDEDVFEPIEINFTDKGYYNGIKSLTKKGEENKAHGKTLTPEDYAIAGQSGWSGITYNTENGKWVIQRGSIYVNDEQVILRVSLRVKPTATVGNTTVTLKGAMASNGEKDIYPSNPNAEISTTVEVVKDISDPDSNGYVRINAGMTVEEVQQSALDGLGNTIFPTIKFNGNTLSSTDYVPTGATSGKYTLIAVGDINSDGRLTTMDLSQWLLLSVNDEDMIAKTNDNQKRAADIEWNGRLTMNDCSVLQNIMVDLTDSRVAVWSGSGDAACVPVKRGN